MEKSSENKMGQQFVITRLQMMARVMNDTLQTYVQRDGTVVALEKPTILRTPAARATGELTSPEQEGERIQLPAFSPLSLSDLGDHSVSALGRSDAGGSVLTPAKKNAPAPVCRERFPAGGQTCDVLERPQEHEVIGIDSSSVECRTHTDDAGKGQSSCAHTSPYTSPPSGATPAAKKAKEDKKAKKALLKRAREEKRAEKAHKKHRTTTSADQGTSLLRKKPCNPEEGRRSESTTFELPLYTSAALESGFMKFATKTLSSGL